MMVPISKNVQLIVAQNSSLKTKSCPRPPIMRIPTLRNWPALPIVSAKTFKLINHMSLQTYQKFCCKCVQCGQTTSKTYARANAGRCKVCVTGIERKPRKEWLCPTCGERELTPYQRSHRYHCDACTRNADTMGYIRELTTPYEPMD